MDQASLSSIVCRVKDAAKIVKIPHSQRTSGQRVWLWGAAYDCTSSICSSVIVKLSFALSGDYSA